MFEVREEDEEIIMVKKKKNSILFGMKLVNWGIIEIW